MFNNILYTCIYIKNNIYLEQQHFQFKYDTTRTYINFILNSMDIHTDAEHNANELSYKYEDYIFNLIIRNGVIILCVITNKYHHSEARKYLKELLDYLWNNNHEIWMNYQISNNIYFDIFAYIKKLTNKYNSNPSASTQIELIKTEINETKDLLLHDIDHVISRGEKLELLIDKTENLNKISYTFKKKAKIMKRRFCCKSYTMSCLIVLFVIAVLYILISLGCGFDFSKCLATDSVTLPEEP